MNSAGLKAAQLPDHNPAAQLVVQLGAGGMRSAEFSPDGRVILTSNGDGTARLWETVSARELRRFNHPGAQVTSAVFAPDGRSVLTAADNYMGGDDNVHLWDTATGRELHRFKNTGGVTSAVFSPKGGVILTSNRDGTARLWETDTWRELHRFEHAGAQVTSAVFAPDGRSVLTVASRRYTGKAATVHLWDVKTGRELSQFTHGGTEEASAVFSPNGEMILTAGEDGFVRLWNVATRKLMHRFESQTSEAASFRFSPNSLSVLTASGDRTVHLWNVKNGQELRRFVGHTTTVYLAVFSPDGHSVLTTSADRTARLWNISTGQELRRLEGHSDPVHLAVFSPGGRSVLTGGDSTVRLWNVSTGQELRRFEGYTESVDSAIFTPDGRFILTASTDLTMRIWDTFAREELPHFKGHSVEEVTRSLGSLTPPYLWNTATGGELRPFENHSGPGSHAIFSPDGRSVLTASEGQSVQFKDAAAGGVRHSFEEEFEPKADAPLSPTNRSVPTTTEGRIVHLRDTVSGQELSRFGGHSDWVDFATFSPDSRAVLTLGRDRILRLWDVTSGHERHRFEHTGTGEIQFPSFSPKGRMVSTLGRDRTIRLWDVASGRELHWFKPGGVEVTRAVFSHDDRWLLTSSRDHTVHLWDVTSRRERHRFEHSGAEVNFGEFAPDGGSVLTVSMDNTMRLWDIHDGKELWRFKSRDSGNLDTRFAPNSRTILTAGDDGPMVLLDAGTGRELSRIGAGEGMVLTAVFSRDSHTILTAHEEGVARLWEVATGKELRRFKGHHHSVNSAVFSFDGRLVLTSGYDGTSRLWNAGTGKELARLMSFTDGTWVVATPDGRFDTNNLEEIKGLHWLMPDDPLRALPLEIFMRDFRKSKLLPQVLAEQLEDSKPERPLEELNRAQPKVLGIEVVPRTEADQVDVVVEIAGGVYKNATTGATQYSSVHDLRLFRDGQLVGQWPEPKADTPDGLSGAELAQWQTDTQVVPANGRTRVTFRGIRLPHRGNKEAVEFSAYAFNEDRVKGETVRTTTPAAAGPVTKRAYLVAIGVDDYGDDRWNLRYATKDARAMAQALEPRLQQAGYDPQVTVLGSDADLKRSNKAAIRAALEGLASVSTPDDLVILFFSGHGYSGKKDAFYLLPEDSQPSKEPNWRQPARGSLERTISAMELSGWMRKMVAAEMVLIIDACHSAASVEGEGFQPGPLGSKGLGQLAYDKRMRVLAASQSDQAAREMGGQIGAGVLTYALVHDALLAKQAADEKGHITLTQWLKYPVRRVPKLFEEIRAGKVNDYGVAVTKDAIPPGMQGAMSQKGAVQVPALFDYTRGAHAGVGLERAIGVSQ